MRASGPAVGSQLSDAVGSAVEALRRYPLRSALSVVGVVLGVASILTVVAVIDGARRDALRQVEALGLQNLVVRNRALTPAELERGRPQWLSWGDATSLHQLVPDVVAAVGLVDRVLPVTGPRRTIAARVVGATADYPATIPSSLSGGRWWRRDEDDRAARVAVIGETLGRSLLGPTDPIGAEVRLAGDWYRVVGVAASAGASRATATLPARSLDDALLVPLSALIASPPSPGARIDQLWLRVGEDRRLMEAAGQVDRALSRLHGGVRDYDVVVPRELLDQQYRTQRSFAVVLATIAAITLVVGGIGVMNVVLTSVVERTPEIGLRRTVGARRGDVHRQFLAEATLLTATGGAAGVLLGFVASWLVQSYTGWPVEVSGLSVVVGLGSAALVGIVSGLYPAIRAGSIPPVEAVRYE